MSPNDKLLSMVEEHGICAAARMLDVHRTTVHNVLKGDTSMSDALAAKLGFTRWWVPVEAVMENNKAKE